LKLIDPTGHFGSDPYALLDIANQYSNNAEQMWPTQPSGLVLDKSVPINATFITTTLVSTGSKFWDMGIDLALTGLTARAAFLQNDNGAVLSIPTVVNVFGSANIYHDSNGGTVINTTLIGSGPPPNNDPSPMPISVTLDATVGNRTFNGLVMKFQPDTGSIIPTGFIGNYQLWTPREIGDRAQSLNSSGFHNPFIPNINDAELKSLSVTLHPRPGVHDVDGPPTYYDPQSTTINLK
jgi:hypothetical protein